MAVTRATFSKPPLSATTTYRLGYSLQDPSGLRSTAVRKGGPRESISFTEFPEAVGRSVAFSTGPTQTFLDGFLGTSVRVRATDRHRTNRTRIALERTNLYGQLAEKLGGEFTDPETAFQLGTLSGFTVGAGETARSVQAVLDDPFGFVRSLQQVARVLQDLGVLTRLIEALPRSLQEKQERTNPYDEDREPRLYAQYQAGWYGGYAAYFLVSMVLGQQATNAIKTSKTFARTVDTLDGDGRLRAAARYLEPVRRPTTAPSHKTGYGLARRFDGGDALDESTARRVLARVKTAGKQVRVRALLRRVDDEKLEALTPEQTDRIRVLLVRTRGDGVALLNDLSTSEVRALARFVDRTGDDGLRVLAGMDDDARRAMFKTHVDDVDMDRWRANVVELTAKFDSISARDTGEYFEDVFTAQRLDGETVEIADDNGIENVMDDLTTARTDDEFIGAKYEADRLADYADDPVVTRIEVEPIEEIDFAVTRTDGTTEFVEAKAANGPLHEGKLDGYFGDAQRKFDTAKDTIEIKKSDEKVLTVGAKNGGLKTDELGQTRKSIKKSIEDRLNEVSDGGGFKFESIRIVTPDRIFEFDLSNLDIGK